METEVKTSSSCPYMIVASVWFYAINSILAQKLDRTNEGNLIDELSVMRETLVQKMLAEKVECTCEEVKMRL